MSNPRRQDAAIMTIEEEPPHEFYAGLLGKRQAPCAAGSTTDAAASSHSSTAVVVPPLSTVRDALDQAVAAKHASVYQRAFSNPQPSSLLSLDASNKGFTLLSRMGWKESQGGLGRNRDGRMEPVKTVLKKDKKGLGHGTRQARVTHRPQTVGRQQQNKKKKESKAEKKRRRKEEMERDAFRGKRARMLLRSDVSDQYEQLYLQLHSRR